MDLESIVLNGAADVVTIRPDRSAFTDDTVTPAELLQSVIDYTDVSRVLQSATAAPVKLSAELKQLITRIASTRDTFSSKLHPSPSPYATLEIKSKTTTATTTTEPPPCLVHNPAMWSTFLASGYSLPRRRRAWQPFCVEMDEDAFLIRQRRLRTALADAKDAKLDLSGSGGDFIFERLRTWRWYAEFTQLVQDSAADDPLAQIQAIVESTQSAAYIISVKMPSTTTGRSSSWSWFRLVGIPVFLAVPRDRLSAHTHFLIRCPCSETPLAPPPPPPAQHTAQK